MSENKSKYKNNLEHYRRRMGFSQTAVLHLLGEHQSSRLWKLEAGDSLPTLLTAFKLSAIYRVPVETLYNDLYIDIREQIRKFEAVLPKGGQRLLPCFNL